jgi:hypothetical protein
MYRDDAEALQAQIRTLSAELEAERKAREAAVAARRAAEAAADEARLAARRGKNREEPFWRKHGAVMTTMAVVMAGAVFGASQCVRHAQRRQQAALEHRHQLETEVYKEKVARVRQELLKLEEHAREELLACRQRNNACRQTGSKPETLSRSQIQGGMRGIKSLVQRCFDRYQIPGLANVQIRIDRDGTVGTARVRGMFADTPTGSCVTAAAGAARFPAFSGNAITITYPFVLR